jgi:hypothetical protein
MLENIGSEAVQPSPQMWPNISNKDMIKIKTPTIKTHNKKWDLWPRE